MVKTFSIDWLWLVELGPIWGHPWISLGILPSNSHILEWLLCTLEQRLLELPFYTFVATSSLFEHYACSPQDRAIHNLFVFVFCPSFHELRTTKMRFPKSPTHVHCNTTPFFKSLVTYFVCLNILNWNRKAVCKCKKINLISRCPGQVQTFAAAEKELY